MSKIQPKGEGELRQRKGPKPKETTDAEDEGPDVERPWWLILLSASVIIFALGGMAHVHYDYHYGHLHELAEVEEMKKESWSLFEEGKYKESLELAHEAKTRAPLIEQREFLGSLMLSLHQLDEALATYRELFYQTIEIAHISKYVTVLHRLGAEYDKERIHAFEVMKLPEHVPPVPWHSSWQCPPHVEESLLPGKPFHDPKDFRVTRRIKENLPAIIHEFDDFLHDHPSEALGSFKQGTYNDLVDKLARKNWTEMILFERGSWNDLLCEEGKPMHTTCQTLRNLPEIEGAYRGQQLGVVSINRLAGGTHLVPHFGPVNWRLVASCGLIVPEPDAITLKVGETETSQWQENECLVFDDSYLNSVKHEGTQPQYVLYASFLVVEPEG